MADFFSTLFGGGAEAEAADKNRAALATYQPQVMDYLKTGYDTGTGNLNQAIGAYAPLATLGAKYGGASDMYLNALGINGPQGNATANAAFQNAPGYTGAVNAGLDVLNRRRATQGMNASGNADIDALTFGQNLQNQQYKDWLTNLAGAGQAGIGALGTAAAGQSSGYTNLANLAGQYAGNQAGVAGNVLSGNVNANNLQAAGEAAGAKNLLGAGLSIASLAMGMPPGMMGGLGSALGGGGGGGGGFSNSLFGSGLGNALGGSYGGSAQNPLPGLNASDYGPGAGLFATYGLG